MSRILQNQWSAQTVTVVGASHHVAFYDHVRPQDIACHGISRKYFLVAGCDADSQDSTHPVPIDSPGLAAE